MLHNFASGGEKVWLGMPSGSIQDQYRFKTNDSTILYSLVIFTLYKPLTLTVVAGDHY